MKVWRVAIAAVALVVAAGTATGVIFAQTGGEPTPETEQVAPEGNRVDNFVERLAANLGISEDQLVDAIRDTQLELLDEAVANGLVDEDRAAEIRERIESGEAPLFPHPPYHKGTMLLRACHEPGELAAFLGLEPEAVYEAREAGQSLAQIAEGQGVSRDELKAFLLGNLEECVAQAVEDEVIDQARADEILARASERIDEVIDATELPRHHRGPRFGPNGGAGIAFDEGAGIMFGEGAVPVAPAVEEPVF